MSEPDIVDLPVHNHCFGCSNEAEGRIVPHYQWDSASSRVTGEIHFGPKTQGPPGHVHGGALFTVLDEAMGGACWLSGHTVVAVSINISYRKMVPLDGRLRVEAWVDRVEGRKVFAGGRLESEDGTVMADSTGVFVVISAEKIGNKIPGLHESIDKFHVWQKFNT